MYLAKIGSPNGVAWRPFTLLILTVSLAVAPMTLFGVPEGHDLAFHMPAWMEAAVQFHQGIIFQRWSAGTNHRFGEPFFIFYPPLSRMIGATLGMALPWRTVPVVYVWLVLILAGATMWKCAQEWLQPLDALVASLLYATNPYFIVNVYKRCAYAELLAGALFPALVLGAIRLAKDTHKAVLSLSLVFAVIWISDLPAAVIASYSLAGLLVLDSLMTHSFRPLLYGGAAILAGFGAIAFFLLPAAWERPWVNMARVMQAQWEPENNFLFAHSNLYGVAFNHNVSWVAMLMIIVTAAAAVLARQLQHNKPLEWRLFVSLAVASIFMMLPLSLVLYRILPELRFVQFPWRWLTPLSVAYALLTASAIAEGRKKWMPRAIAAFAIAGVAAVIMYSSKWNPHFLDELSVVVHSDAGFRQIASWDQPPGSPQPPQLDESAPLIAFAKLEDEKEAPGHIAVEQWAAERKVFSVASPRPLLLKLKLMNYPAWRAKINGTIVPIPAIQSGAETGQMLVALPAGLSKVEIHFGRTLDRTVGILISLATLVTVFPLLLWLRGREVLAACGETPDACPK